MKRANRLLPDVLLFLGAGAIVAGAYLLVGLAGALLLLGAAMIVLAVWMGI